MLKVLNKSGYRLSEWHQEVYCISKPWQPLKSWTFPVDIIFLPPCPLEALVSFSVTHVWLEKMFSPRWFRCSCMPCMAMVVPLDEDLHRDRVTAWPYPNDGFASFILTFLLVMFRRGIYHRFCLNPLIILDIHRFTMVQMRKTCFAWCSLRKDVCIDDRVQGTTMHCNDVSVVMQFGYLANGLGTVGLESPRNGVTRGWIHNHHTPNQRVNMCRCSSCSGKYTIQYYLTTLQESIVIYSNGMWPVPRGILLNGENTQIRIQLRTNLQRTKQPIEQFYKSTFDVWVS